MSKRRIEILLSVIYLALFGWMFRAIPCNAQTAGPTPDPACFPSMSADNESQVVGLNNWRSVGVSLVVDNGARPRLARGRARQPALR
jgi:hypothetical protein